MPATPIVLFLACCFSAASAHLPSVPVITRHLLHSLGVSKLPDLSKMNVSQEEYESKFKEYERRMNERNVAGDYLSFQSFKQSDNKVSSVIRLDWARNVSNENVESSIVRVFVEGIKGAELEIRKLGGAREVRTMEDLPRWVEVNGGYDWWKVKLSCRGCRLSRPALNLVTRKGRPRRDSGPRSPRSHCRSRGPNQRRCCRHPMQVVFSQLPGYEFILQPFGFDAGFCKGTCPHSYNPANHHATLQSLVWRLNKDRAPRPCCAPTRLEPLQILHLDEHDPTKLKVATWSDIKVTQCACF